MINGTIIVVVILKETVGTNEDRRQIRWLNAILFNQSGENVPNTIRNIEVVNKNVVQQITEFQELKAIDVQQMGQDLVANDAVLQHDVFVEQMEQFKVGDEFRLDLIGQFTLVLQAFGVQRLWWSGNMDHFTTVENVVWNEANFLRHEDELDVNPQ